MMVFMMNEQDVGFCVNAIKLIKDNGATFVRKDTSAVNDRWIDVCKNQDGEAVIKLTEADCVKERSAQDELDVVKENIEKLLRELKDLGVVKE